MSFTALHPSLVRRDRSRCRLSHTRPAYLRTADLRLVMTTISVLADDDGVQAAFRWRFS